MKRRVEHLRNLAHNDKDLEALAADLWKNKKHSFHDLKQAEHERKAGSMSLANDTY